jgi:F420-non-reducing hydrogenase small subunit
VVDLAEDILGVVERVNIIFWPCAMDFKKADLEAVPDGSLLATLLNGAVRSSEQEEMVRLLRRKSRYLIAYGSCACSGGVPALANQFSREQILRFVYEQAPTNVNEGGTRPLERCDQQGCQVTLPTFRHAVRCLDQVVDVDYYVPGCPPTAKITQAAIGALLDGRMPPKGSVLSPDIALCEECSRRDSKPADLAFTGFKRPVEKLLDPDICFLAQGVVCMGPGTRQGCGAQCPSGNMPCTGCFGGTDRVKDHGAKMLSSLCANLAPREEADIDRALAGIPDPVGTLYRYGLARSLLRGNARLMNGVQPQADL